ncbi:uncharacterized protein LOC114580517 [Dendrobium catenatum]|uniref:uncharacterized protein LOC114580517 n=1 Tax=Dendrobium catenatum TaxID=906689 RepID=UPI00109FECB6|nr:uncharacterized protein LOC114580517 [Dendrobium catenatum]
MMGWMEGNLAGSVLGVLIFLLVIFESRESVAHPPLISPSKPNFESHIVEEIVPSVQPSASLDSTGKSLTIRNSVQVSRTILFSTMEEHNLQRERNLEGYQAPDVHHVTENNLSSAHDNPPATQIREGGDIGSTSLNGSPFTLQHAPAPSQRKIQNVQPDSEGIHPSMSSPSLAKGFNSLPMSSMAATPTETSSHLSPKNYSHFKGSSSHISHPQNEANTAHAPSNSPPHSPERRKIHRPKPAPAISPTEKKIDRIEGSTVSSPFFLHPPSSQPSGWIIFLNYHHHYSLLNMS